MSNKNNTQVKNQVKVNTTPTTDEIEELEKALGQAEEVAETLKTEAEKLEAEIMATQPEAKAETPEAKAEAKSPLEVILEQLPQDAKDKISKLPEDMKLDVAQTWFKMMHPEGLTSEFNARLTAELPAFVEKLAKEYMIDLTGKQIQVMFPDGDGTPTATIADPKATGKTKASGTREPWGESSVTDKNGKTVHYASAGAMGKGLGLLMKGWMFGNTTDCFTKPHDLNGNPRTDVKYEIVSAERGKGIHIKQVK